MKFTRSLGVQLLFLIGGVASFIIGGLTAYSEINYYYVIYWVSVLVSLMYLAVGAGAISAAIALHKRMRQYPNLSKLSAVLGFLLIVSIILILINPSTAPTSFALLLLILAILCSWVLLPILGWFFGRKLQHAVKTPKIAKVRSTVLWFLGIGASLNLLLIATADNGYLFYPYSFNASIIAMTSTYLLAGIVPLLAIRFRSDPKLFRRLLWPSIGLGAFNAVYLVISATVYGVLGQWNDFYAFSIGMSTIISPQNLPSLFIVALPSSVILVACGLFLLKKQPSKRRK